MTAPRRPPMRRIVADLRPHARPLLLASVAATIAAAASAVGPYAVGVAIDRGVLARDMTWVAVGAALLFVAATLQLGSTWAQTRWMGRFAHGYMRDLRRGLLDHLFALDLDFFTRVRTGRLVSRLTSDVDNLQQFVEHGLALVARTTLLVVATLGVMVVASWQLTVVVALVLAPLGVAAAWFRRRAYDAQVDVRDKMGDLLGHVSESLTGARVIQAYTYEDPRREAFSRVNDDTYAAKIGTVRLAARFYLVLEFLSPTAIAAVIAGGAWLAAGGDVTVGTVVAFTLYVGRLFEPIQQLTELAAIMQQASASYGKVYAFRDERPLVADAPDAVAFRPGAGDIHLDGVSFRYDPDGPEVVRNVTLQIPAGQRVALVGGSGAGKSTLAKLVARFYDPTAGSITIDGQDPRTVTGRSLRGAVALVPQDGFLFDGTVADNIALACEGCSREDVERACTALGINERLEVLPDGLDTEVSTRGHSLSSGQRQLVALARALVLAPHVLILDEATSNLDPATDALVEEALETLLAGRTALIIAHRVETAMRADRVVMLRDGAVAEDGTPEELLARGGVFATWVTSVRETATA